MPIPHPPPLQLVDIVGPAAGAIVFVILMSLVKEPARRTFNAIFLGGAAGVYLSGGLGPWELVAPLVFSIIAYQGLRSHRWIGVGWLLHASWDVVHHLYGNPIWPFMATSSFGCIVFDSLIAVWFLAGAPSVLSLRSRLTPGRAPAPGAGTLAGTPAGSSPPTGGSARAAR